MADEVPVQKPLELTPETAKQILTEAQSTPEIAKHEPKDLLKAIKLLSNAWGRRPPV